MRIWKRRNRKSPFGIVAVWPMDDVSAAEIPPKKAQLLPANGGAAPPPVPQASRSHSGVLKLVEVCVVQAGHGSPASKVPSTTPGETAVQPVGWAQAPLEHTTTARHASRTALVQVIGEGLPWFETWVKRPRLSLSAPSEPLQLASAVSRAVRAAACWWMSRATTSPQYKMIDTEISSHRASTMMPSSVP